MQVMSTSTALIVHETSAAITLPAGGGELVTYDANHERDTAAPQWFESIAHGSLEVQAALGLSELPGDHAPQIPFSVAVSGAKVVDKGCWSKSNMVKRQLTHKRHKQMQVLALDFNLHWYPFIYSCHARLIHSLLCDRLPPLKAWHGQHHHRARGIAEPRRVGWWPSPAGGS